MHPRVVRPLALVFVLALAVTLLPDGLASAQQDDPVAEAAAGPIAGQPGDPGVEDPQGSFDVEIRRTENGIPHITGDSYADIGYGWGFAFAEDNICTAADFYVTVNGERSKFFGPDATWTFRGNGQTFGNLESDYYYTAINESGVIEDLLAQDPPHGPVEGLRQGVEGYVAGYNAYLESVGGPDGIDDPRCKGEEWVRPIEEIDAYRRFFQLASLASAGVVVQGIGGATPPPGIQSSGDGGAAMPTDAQRAAIEEFPERFSEVLGIGSNAYGLGSDITDNGRGMVLGNPHFPWHEGERLYQSHLTIPGVLDVAGASLYGVPIVLIGHTDGMAWSHTVSTAFRFTPFQLTLAPGSPTTYLVDGSPVEMEERPVTVEARTSDGDLEERSTSLWWTTYGPVFTELVGIPLPWTSSTAFALGDANVHMRYLNHFFEKNHVQSVRELHEVQKRNLGVPWVNTMAADASGETLYSDVSVVPNVPDEHAEECNTALGQATFSAIRLPVLDGSRSACNWQSDDDAPAEGVFGPSNLPHLFRDDYISNSNDSYWLSNPEEPLTGFATIIGDEETARTLRTRLGLKIVEDRLDGDDEYRSDPANRWTQDILQDAVFNNRQHAAELTRDDLVEMCRGFGGTAPSASGPTDTGDACDVLEAWDLRDDLDSYGAVLFREFWSRARGATPDPWVNGFDADDPVNTPNTLDTGHPQVRQALGDAINLLRNAGIPLDAGLRGWMAEDRDGDGAVTDPVPIHGGPGVLGVFNAINVVFDPDPDDGDGVGYPDVEHGSSFVMAMQFVDGDCPVDADAIVTYSQSEDVTSPWFADQTDQYSRKRWNTMPYCEDEIRDRLVEAISLDDQAGEELVQARSQPPTVPPAERLAGPDRYATAAAVSASRFDTEVPVAYVATGADFADALAGVPIAVREHAPILLTGPDGLPQPTVEELRRLDPARIVVLGGSAAVSDRVVESLHGLTHGTVTRLAGPDRFATAAVIARTFADVTDRVYLATGAAFPDAVAAGARAGADGAPVLLTAPDELPEATATALERIAPSDVVVVGGAAAVGDGVVAAVEDVTGATVRRLAGADRFATAAEVAAQDTDTGIVYAATGLDFPDSLTGAVLAGLDDEPVLLVAPGHVPEPTAAALADLGASRAVVLGGTAAVSEAVAEEVRGALR